MIERLNAALSGRYRIERELGAGGMATVYLADDLKHDRQVAVKVLRPELAAVVGADRFLAEIKTTANLQHPHILALFDSGEADGFLFYVMPHVEGESLRERVDREHQLPVAEALAIAKKVAAALQYAHEQGVVHRDVKPANILLSRGEPLVADFGIALAVSEAGGGRITETGLSLGTPHYMSPEQAAGERSLDRRSDVYALACVLYEMLSGQPPYRGPTAQAVLARILTGDPSPPTEHRKSVPAHVEHAVLKALERLPADRFDSAADFSRALENPSFRRGIGAAGAGTAGRGSRAAVTAAVAVLAFLAGALVWSRFDATEAPRTDRQRIVLGTVDDAPSFWVAFGTALHPDGGGIVFGDTPGSGDAAWQLWWKATDEANAVPLPNTGGALVPTFSPDGEWLAFFVDGELRKQPLGGGRSILLADSAGGGAAQALAWLEDGTILYEDADFNLVRIGEDGDAPEVLASRDDVGAPMVMTGLRGGGGALLVACQGAGTCPPGPATLLLVDLEADTIHTLADDVGGAWHLDGERVVYVDVRGAVFAASLDREAGVLGTPVPLFAGVRISGTIAEIQLAPDGSLLYRRGGAVGTLFLERIVWVDRHGRVTPVDQDWWGEFSSVALSPDGARLAVTDDTPEEGSAVLVKELPDGPLTSLTTPGPSRRRPFWTPDGRHVVYQVRRPDTALVFDLRRFDASTAARRFLELAPEDDLPPEERDALGIHQLSFSRDGRYVVYGVGAVPRGDLRYMEIDGADTTHHDLLVREGTNEIMPELSPDGRWLAYVSDVSGTPEVYVRPFPDVMSTRVKVSDGGGWEPLWSRDGAELYYRDGEGMQVAAAVETEPTLRVTAREQLFQRRMGRFPWSDSERSYDVAADGRFVMISVLGNPAGEDASGTGLDLVLVKNWFRELEEVLGGG